MLRSTRTAISTPATSACGLSSRYRIVHLGAERLRTEPERGGVRPQCLDGAAALEQELRHEHPRRHVAGLHLADDLPAVVSQGMEGAEPVDEVGPRLAAQQAALVKP